jgi:hypothetical protein
MALTNRRILLVALINSFFVTPVFADIIWPALIVANGVISSWFLVIISIVIEAWFFCIFIREINFKRALLLSVVGNAVSVLLGSGLVAAAMILYHGLLDSFLGGTFGVIQSISTYILMYVGSAFVELGMIKLFFRYTVRQLILPVFIGNLVTYVLVAIYQYPRELMWIWNSLVKW